MSAAPDRASDERIDRLALAKPSSAAGASAQVRSGTRTSATGAPAQAARPPAGDVSTDQRRRPPPAAARSIGVRWSSSGAERSEPAGRDGLGSPYSWIVPALLLPMLAGGTGPPPNPDGWMLKPKLDGQRIIAIVEDGHVVLTNRRGLEATATFPEVEGLAAALAPHDVVLDGEVVAFNEKGQTSFQRLQRRMHVVQPTARLLAESPVSFVAFDVLWFDGECLSTDPRRSGADSRQARDQGLGPWQTAPVSTPRPTSCRGLPRGRRGGLHGQAP